MRAEYGKQLVLEGKKYYNLIVLEGDLKESTQTIHFQKRFPDRFFEVGVAEQNMVGIAAGLARCGKIPIVSSFASFISLKACEQVRTCVAFQNLNVKFVVSHAGVSSGTAGPTHQTIEDIAIMRSIPNMNVFVPGDPKEAREVLIESLKLNGPVYLRLSAMDFPQIIPDKIKFEVGKAFLMYNLGEIGIITTGTTLSLGKEIYDKLKMEYDIGSSILHMASIKPLDKRAIIELSKQCKYIFTIEEHNIIGGLGSAVCEVISEIGNSIVLRFGIRDHFCEIGSQKYLFEIEGLTPEKIINKILNIIRNR